MLLLVVQGIFKAGGVFGKNVMLKNFSVPEC